MSKHNRTPHVSLKSDKKHRGVKIFLIIILALIIGFAGCVGAIYFIGRSRVTSVTPDNGIKIPDSVEGVKSEENGEIIYYNGKKYTFNENMFTMLFIGVDRENMTEDEGIGYNGQADANYLCAFNSETGQIYVLAVNRDTYTEVDMYSAEGVFLRSDKMQLCLSYAYGDGRETSCENTVTAVSRLLCNIPIKYYVAIDLDALPVLTDKVGGVEVPEYSNHGMDATGNMMTVDGSNVENYIVSRDIDVLESNLPRIERQKYFINAYAKKAIEMTKSDLTFPVTLYNTVNDYMVTNIGVSVVSYVASTYIGSSLDVNMRSIDGEVSEYNGHAIFTPDNDSIFSNILEMYYTEITE